MQFNSENYTIKEITLNGNTLTYRAFNDIPYVMNPINPEFQKLSIYVPENYYHDKSINSYTLKTAPIFMPNGVGGYMPSEIEEPGYARFGKPGTINSLFWALHHGYVVVSPAIRGRSQKNEAGKFTGKAPACLVDYKAAVRYLHANAHLVPGDTNKIITNGTSAGGALSSLMATTINHPDFEPFLEEIEAFNSTDKIFAASCYCPITNLEHADMAYEWQFNSVPHYSRKKMVMTDGGRPSFSAEDGELTELQFALSGQLKALFPDYLNNLHLMDSNGDPLLLDADGKGSFVDYLGKLLLASAKKENVDVASIPWLDESGKLDIDGFACDITRMKTPPAFDDITGHSPENDLFGDQTISCKHFTTFSYEHSTGGVELADMDVVKMLNPMHYIDDEKATTAQHIRIRHGQRDRDTSLAISAILAAKLRQSGADVDYQSPWGVEHAGDYDLEELFDWIDRISK